MNNFIHDWIILISIFFYRLIWFFLFQLLRLCKDYKTELKEGVARLSIQRVYPEDEGEYTCVAYNQLGKDSSKACLIVDGTLYFNQIQ